MRHRACTDMTCASPGPDPLPMAQGSFDVISLDPATGQPMRASAGLTLTFYDDGSTLTLFGYTNLMVGATLAITGGTGRYAYGVAGQVDFAATTFASGPFEGQPGLTTRVCITK